MDGDGEITTEELRSAMIKLMGEHMSRREIDAIVKEADDNGDGTVDFEGNELHGCSSSCHVGRTLGKS